jgi:hypothetical protein
MILVILAHVRWLLDESTVSPASYLILAMSTRIASVAFMSVSGTMISYFLFYRDHWMPVYQKYIRRAVFLIVLIHPAIRLATYYYLDDPGGLGYSMLHDYPITDTIALSLILAPPIIRITGATARAALALLLLAITPPVVAFCHPGGGAMGILKEVLFGVAGEETAILNFAWPVVPWLAIFLSGTLLGQALAKVRKNLVPASILRNRLRMIAIILAAVGVFLTTAYKALKTSYGDVVSPELLLAIYPSRTTSLLPIYLAVLVLVFSILLERLDIRGQYNRIAWFASVFGRTSLFTFVTQFVVVWTIPALLGLKGRLNPWQFLLFLPVALLTCWMLSYAYGRLRGRIPAADYILLTRRRFSLVK